MRYNDLMFVWLIFVCSYPSFCLAPERADLGLMYQTLMYGSPDVDWFIQEVGIEDVDEGIEDFDSGLEAEILAFESYYRDTTINPRRVFIDHLGRMKYKYFAEAIADAYFYPLMRRRLYRAVDTGEERTEIKRIWQIKGEKPLPPPRKCPMKRLLDLTVLYYT